MTRSFELNAAFGDEAPFDHTVDRSNAAVRCAVLHPDAAGLLRRHESAPASRRDPEAELAEITALAAALGLDIVHQETVTLREIKPATFVSLGLIERWATLAKAEDLTLVVINAALSPVQHRNLERALDCKVLDRTALILEIFGARARTKEGRLQVELASLTFQRSRLVRSWTHLERQRGGAGFMGGPGERQIEIDRRLIDDRIVRLKAELEQVRRTRALHRQARERVPYPVVALVGYTNAGKSTLFNRLTRADVLAKDMLFATLDPTLRELPLPGGERILLADTVGFVSNLPHELVEAFRATLEEVRAARLILHVIDLANPDFLQQVEDVDRVLHSLDIDAELKDSILFLGNKCDLAPPEARELFRSRFPAERRVEISAVTGEGNETLFAAMAARLFADHVERQVTLSFDQQGAALAWLHRHGKVLSQVDGEFGSRVTVRLSPLASAQFDRQFSTAATLPR